MKCYLACHYTTIFHLNAFLSTITSFRIWTVMKLFLFSCYQIIGAHEISVQHVPQKFWFPIASPHVLKHCPISRVTVRGREKCQWYQCVVTTVVSSMLKFSDLRSSELLLFPSPHHSTEGKRGFWNFLPLLPPCASSGLEGRGREGGREVIYLRIYGITGLCNITVWIMWYSGFSGHLNNPPELLVLKRHLFTACTQM